MGVVGLVWIAIIGLILFAGATLDMRYMKPEDAESRAKTWVGIFIVAVVIIGLIFAH